MRVEEGNQWASFKLEDASSSAGQAAGSSVSYPDALPGVDVSYTAQADALKEELILKSASATRAFSWDLKASPGLSTELNEAGGVDLKDDQAETVISVAPPVITDASGALAPDPSYELQQASGGHTLSLQVDQAWHQDPARIFPVVVDPTTVLDHANTLRHCYIAQQTPNQNLCISDNLQAGYDGTNAKRALLEFNFGQFPDNAEVLHAELKLNQLNNASVAPDFSLRPVTEFWDMTATWNNRTSASAWPSAGGSYDSGGGYLAPNVGDASSDEYWHPTDLVENWISGERVNQGLILKQASESAGGENALLSFASPTHPDVSKRPTLTVTWDQGGMGRLGTYALETHRLTDKMSIAANVAGGNLLVENNDLKIAGLGMDLTIDRYYNNLLESQFLSTQSAPGTGWSLSTGHDIGLLFFRDGSAAYFGPSGYRLAFNKDPVSGTFDPPPGIYADLAPENSGTGFELKFPKTLETFNFFASGKLKNRKDRNGNTITYNYTGDRLSSITDTRNRTVNFTYNAQGYVQTIADVAGSRTWSFSYTGDRLTGYTDPAGKITTYGYDPVTKDLTSITDALGNQTLFTYYADRHIKDITYDSSSTGGDSSHFDYVQEQTPVQCPDHASLKTKVTDARGTATPSIPDDYVTTYCYGALSRVRKILDANNHLTSLDYNSEANLTRYTDDSGNKTDFAYDSSGQNVSGVTTPASSGTTGGSSTVTYDSVHKGQPSVVTTPEGKKTQFLYDTKGNLTKVTKGYQSTEAAVFDYAYNTNGTLNKIDAPPTGATADTTFTYFTNGELKTITYPAPLGAVNFTYDTVSRTKTIKDGKLQTTTYAYDSLDRTTGITPATGSALTYVYDAAGNMDQRKLGTATTTFDQDEKNQVKSRTNPDATISSYTYNRVGSLKTISDPVAGTTTYSYDPVSLVDSITDPQGLVTTFAYDNRNQKTQTTYPGGIEAHNSYYNSGQLKRTWANLAATPGSHFSDFSYDYTDAGVARDVGFLQKLTDERLNRATTYAYDGQARLKTAETKEGTTQIRKFTYAYDARSNRTQKVWTERGSATTTNYTYGNANELKTVGGTTYTVDNNGSETNTGSGRTSTYDAKNNATSIKVGTTTTAMTYADSNQVERSSKGTTNYAYDVLGIARERTGTSPAAWYLRDDRGAPLAQKDSSGKKSYFITDHLGSVVALADSTGAIKRYIYGPYGENVFTSPETIDTPWRFAQGYRDSQTGLTKLGTRYYDPDLGRFTQMDLQFGDITDPISLNRWQYAGCDPVNNIDPLGTNHVPTEICVSIAAFGGIAALLTLGTIFFPASVALFLVSTGLSIIAFTAFIKTGCAEV